ncbi:alkaline phosphatase [Psychrobium sp. 1_MG-2023]|uniref:alkaline phosphatase n=1 Tax=Psychrobium sp. 1_MG-2023 TaxID=3062624 RepID=UPI000C328FD5|nr:alkaline phosphatase [Psychrobium sp. 1_MG-2023]MDP2560956.1 alkaline phosphatase [Psychrobium sp. 1_MG-2023]PKF56028.1 alkaline phosphatase [Alteromonadales bacterium alter-6D02]
MKKVLSSLMLCAAFGASAHQDTEQPKNIIMIVGDGMGPAYTAAYRYFKDNPDTQAVEQTVFDRILVGRSTTYPAKVSGIVTDSAASGTALATGYKSYNGAIGVDVNETPVKSVMHYAKTLGKSTGLVVTSQINHATPASYVAHAKSRRMYNEIADQYFDIKIDGKHAVDVMLGGGWQYFIRDDRDLTKEFQQAGYQYIDSYSDLNTINNNQVLGLFADKGLPWALDDTNRHRLKAMTVAAIDRLDNNDNGFFMLIEGSQIDWGGHANDVAAAMTEMDDLAVTVEWLEGYVANNPDTLVVMTADHSTGGFTIGANGEYAWRPQLIHSMKASPEAISKAQAKLEKLDTQAINAQLGFELTKQEIVLLLPAHKTTRDGSDRKAKRALATALKTIISARTNTGWTTSGHTGVDVPVFAFGRQQSLFAGQIDNTDIAKKIFTLLGKK